MLGTRKTIWLIGATWKYRKVWSGSVLISRSTFYDPRIAGFTLWFLEVKV